MSIAIKPGSPEHLATISPSKVAAILGVSRWESPFELWHRMKGNVPPEPPKDRFDVGHAAEAMLAELWRIQNPDWQLSRGEVQIAHSRFGFPVVATIDRRARRGAHRRVVEFKTANDLDSLEEWGDPNLDGEAPMDYVAQVTAQMHITGYTEHAAHLLIMGPYFKHRTYVIDYDPELGIFIEQKCSEFYASLAGDVAPELDDSTPTYRCVRALHPDIEDVTAQVDPILAAEFLESDRAFKALEAEHRGLKTRVLFAMGKARKGIAGNLAVADRRPNGKGSVSLYPNKKTSTDQLRELIAP